MVVAKDLIKEKGESGQAVVEGAFLIPIIFIALLILMQPAFILYDRIVMEASAGEACRMLVTASSQEDSLAIEEIVHRRLGAIPEQDNFHIHQPSCSWGIELSGLGETDKVQVVIRNELKLLPLFDFGAQALGLLNSQGNYEMSVSANLSSHNSWSFTSSPA